MRQVSVPGLIVILMVLFSSTLFSQSFEWQQTNGPFGGNVSKINVCPDGNLIAVSGNRIFKSTDKGNSWNDVGYSAHNTLQVAVNKNGEIFAAENGLVSRSADGGQTWIQSIVTADQSSTNLVIDKEGYLFVTIYNKVCKSTDNGVTWTASEDIPVNFIYDISVNYANAYFIATNNGVYRSTDKGYSWTDVTGSLTNKNIRSIISTAQGKTFIISEGSVYSSTNNGSSWNISYSSIGDYVSRLGIDSSGNLWASFGYKLIKSINNGSSWTVIKNFTDPDFILAMLLSPDGMIYMGGTNGVLKSSDGGKTWENKNSGIKGTSVHELVKSGDKLFAAGYKDIYRTANKGDDWQDLYVFNNTTSELNCLARDKDGILYIGDMRGINISSNNGSTWTRKQIDLAEGFIHHIKPLENGHLLILTAKQLLRSVNNGNSWQILKTWPESYVSGKVIVGKSNTLFTQRADGVYSSSDGILWSQVTPASTAYFDDLLITNKGTLYAGSSQGLYISRDNGLSWTLREINPGSGNVSPLFNAQNGSVYANTTLNLMVSDDDGNTWTYLDSRESRNFDVILSLRTDNEGYLYAGTQVRGVYRTKNPVLKILAPDVTAKPGNNKAILTWSRNTSSDFLKYNIYGSHDHYPTALIGSSEGDMNDTTFTIAGLTNNSPYYVVVSAVDKQGNESFSEELSVTPVPLPSKPVLYSLEDQSVNTPVNIILKWSKCLYAASYNIQLSLDSTFGTGLISNTEITDTIKSLTGLSNFVKFYWRVRAKGVSGFGEWSSTWSFTTIIAAPAVPTAVSPLNNAVHLPVTQQLKWNRAVRAGTYHIQLSKLESFSSFNINDSTVTDTLLNVNLENDTKYYWRIRSKNIGGVSLWSSVRIFTTIVAAPEKPVLVTPAQNDINVSPACILKWRKSARAENYALQFSGNSDFTDLLFNEDILMDTTFNTGPLIYNTKYYWRVRAKNIGGETDWSAGEFRTVVAAPGSPYLSEPQNNAVNLPVNLVIKWRKLTQADTYNIQISTSADFSKIVLNDTTVADTFKQVTLGNNITYYWKVRGKNAGGYSSWSDFRYFRTIVALPTVPVPSSPENNSKNQEETLVLKWNPVENAEYYTLQLADEANFTTIIFEDSTLTAASKEIKDLQTGWKYYWRVRAENYAGVSNYSAVWSFTTIMYAPEALAAENLSYRKVKLNWSDKTENEQGFILERKAENETGYRLIDTLKANITEYTDSTVEGTTNYTFRVKSFTKYASSSYSNEAVILTATSLNGQDGIPTEYALLQNHPNPFNPLTLINFALPEQADVNLMVYDVTGREVAILISDRLDAGYHSVTFNGEGLSSGLYLYRLQANDFIETGKMMLMK